MRDTVWVSDHDGAVIGSKVWTCDHLYVLTEQVLDWQRFLPYLRKT